MRFLAFGAALVLAGCGGREEPAPAAVPAPSAPPWAGASARDAAAAPLPTDVVPERFRGEWNTTPADCGTGMNDSRLVIGAREIRFYETSGSVRRVEQPAPDEIAILAALSGEGEGPTESTHRFRLSADGALLSTVGEGAPLQRRRCPSG